MILAKSAPQAQKKIVKCSVIVGADELFGTHTSVLVANLISTLINKPCLIGRHSGG